MKSTKDLRNYLLDSMQKVAADEMSIDKAKGISNLSQQVYNTLNIELKTAQVRSNLDGSNIKEVEF